MADLINREDALHYIGNSLVRKHIEELPAIEEPKDGIVRCKDCQYRKRVEHCIYGQCMYMACMVQDDDFCSHGELKTGQMEMEL